MFYAPRNNIGPVYLRKGNECIRLPDPSARRIDFPPGDVERVKRRITDFRPATQKRIREFLGEGFTTASGHYTAWDDVWKCPNGHTYRTEEARIERIKTLGEMYCPICHSGMAARQSGEATGTNA